MSTGYVHGYTPDESTRLMDQAATLADLLHHDTAYPSGSLVLEAGCGVGAQTVTLAANSPGAHLVSIDISETSIVQARRRVLDAGFTHVEFRQADIARLPFAPNTFDHVFVCFVLEHLAEPAAALSTLLTVLKPGGSITVIEGDHGSTFFHPDHADARQAIGCLVELQRRHGGDATIGRRLYPLLTSAGIAEVHVSPRHVYADGSRPHLQEGFTRKTFAAMVEGVEPEVLSAGLMSADAWRRAIAALHRAAETDGVFSYTFFKAVGIRPPRATALGV